MCLCLCARIQYTKYMYVTGYYPWCKANDQERKKTEKEEAKRNAEEKDGAAQCSQFSLASSIIMAQSIYILTIPFGSFGLREPMGPFRVSYNRATTWLTWLGDRNVIHHMLFSVWSESSRSRSWKRMLPSSTWKRPRMWVNTLEVCACVCMDYICVWLHVPASWMSCW